MEEKVKWEYKLAFFDSDTESVEMFFNSLGDDKWELVDVYVAGFSGRKGLAGWSFFKRQKSPDEFLNKFGIKVGKITSGRESEV